MYGRVRICAISALSLGLGLALLATARPARAEMCGEIPSTLIMLDRSASMDVTLNGQTRWKAAVDAVNTLTTSFAGRLDFGLMLFPGTASYCEPGSLTVACSDSSAAAIASAMQSTYPQGNTPLGDTLGVAQTYLQGLGSSKPRYIIVITDGEETCYGDPPAAAGALLSAGIKTYVVGFGSGVDPAALTDLAVAGGTSTYYQADNLPQLDAALQQIAAQLSCCGNAQLDAGELCDITIAAGQPGACPTSCYDGDSCTADVLTGAACNTSCSFPLITGAAHNDGCCPPGQNSLSDSDCAPACGDGVLDAGEQCETAIVVGPGACPTSCDDADDCTADALTGSGCAAHCSFTPITSPVGDDGCCPTGATSASDSDCPVLCGNGALEVGEECDTAIAAGAAGACPTSCDDGDPCTADVLRHAACMTRCQHKPIDQPISGDGCCLAGANNLTDKDCPVVCGNGAVEGGELCDTGIPQGKPGACPHSCDDGDACTTDKVTGSGCNAACTTQAIGPRQNVADGCCPAGLSSRDDADCPPPCNPDRSEQCVDLCAAVSCPDGEFCNMGTCEKWPDAAGSATPEEDSREAPPGSSTADEKGGGAGLLGAEGQGDQGQGEFFGNSGCGCATGGSTADALPAALLVALLLLASRRGRRRRSGGPRKRPWAWS